MKLSNTKMVFKHLSLIGQLGISMIAPILICALICYYVNRKYNIGWWIYIPGLLFGLGASFMTAYKVYLSESKKANKESENRIGFNEHG